MANIPEIQFRRSETVGAIPDPADILVGELVINIADSKIYTKNSSGDIVVMGAGDVVPDSDRFYTIAGGVTTGSTDPVSEITILKNAANNNWQSSTPAVNADIGTVFNVMQQSLNSNWAISSDHQVRSGWHGAQNDIAVLDYNGTASYAAVNSYFNTTYTIPKAYQSAGDHASLGLLNGYFIWQYFASDVSIGNGTNLGTFVNGRPAVPSERYQDFSVEFYNASGDLLASQRWSGETGNNATYTISAGGVGTITGVRSVVFRGDNGLIYNPGFNRINLYVNGSTAYPTTAEGVGTNKWGFGWRNVGNSTATPFPNPDEVFCIWHASTTSTSTTSGANMFTNTSYQLNNTDSTPSYLFWWNKPHAIAGGTFRNGADASNYYTRINFRYYDDSDNEIYNDDVSYTSAGTQIFTSNRKVKYMTMEGLDKVGTTGIYGWYPGFSSPAANQDGNLLSSPEIWIKNSDATAPVYIDGQYGEKPNWIQLA